MLVLTRPMLLIMVVLNIIARVGSVVMLRNRSILLRYTRLLMDWPLLRMRRILLVRWLFC